MVVEKEIQEIIDNFIEELEGKQNAIIDFNRKVQEIIYKSKQAFNSETDKLNEHFLKAEISEQEYRQRFLKFKEQIIKETKQKLDILIQSLK